MNISSSPARSRDAFTSAGFVLHTHAFRETSLIVELFCRSHGRLGVLAKGARRPRSVMRGTLMAFQPMQLTWSGKAELKTLHRAEWGAGYLQLKGDSLMCGFYLNELLLKLLPREDPHEALFDAYALALSTLRDTDKPGRVLRAFETTLLRELGYALNLDMDTEGRRVRPESRYEYVVERGPKLVADEATGDGIFKGVTLLRLSPSAMAQPLMGSEDEDVDQESRALMRQAIAHYLNGQELRTRQLLRELQEL